MAPSFLQTLPNRPIFRSEFQQMEAHDAVTDLIPLYAGMINPAAVGTQQVHGFTLATETTVYSVRFDPDDNTWTVIWEASRESASTDEVLQTGFNKLRADFGLTSESETADTK